MRRIDKPVGAEAGYLYDHIRQTEKDRRNQIEKYDELKRKMNKLSKKNRPTKLKK